MKIYTYIVILAFLGCSTALKTTSVHQEVEQEEEVDAYDFTEDTVVVSELDTHSEDSMVHPPNLVEYFEGDYFKAIEEAKNQGKNVFIDFTASWCAPCIQMDRETFSVKEVGERLNKGFINLRVDSEDFDYYILKEKYAIEQLPTFLIVSHKEKELYRITGFKFWNRLLDEIKNY